MQDDKPKNKNTKPDNKETQETNNKQQTKQQGKTWYKTKAT
mgnify:CR=1 FL=1